MRKFNVTPEYLHRTACHEAGHAVGLFVAAIEFGIDFSNVVRGIKVDTTGVGYLIDFYGNRFDCRGLITCNRVWLDLINRSNLVTTVEKQRLAHMLERHAIALLCGPYAQEISEGRELSETDNLMDFLEVEKISKKIDLLNLPYSAFFRRSWTSLIGEARATVSDNWPTIEAVAQRLVFEGELSGQEAYDIFAATSVKLAA